MQVWHKFRQGQTKLYEVKIISLRKVLLRERTQSPTKFICNLILYLLILILFLGKIVSRISWLGFICPVVFFYALIYFYLSKNKNKNKNHTNRVDTSILSLIWQIHVDVFFFSFFLKSQFPWYMNPNYSVSIFPPPFHFLPWYSKISTY